MLLAWVYGLTSESHETDADIVAAPIKSLAIRQVSSSQSSGIDGNTIQLAAQKAADLLTCRGVGGVASAGLGLMNGANLKNILFSKDDGSGVLDLGLLKSLPEEPFMVTSEGNNFKVVLKNMAISVNGWKGRDFVIITALHSKLQLETVARSKY